MTDPTTKQHMDREALIHLIADRLSGTYHCNRVWEAWNVGTMTEADFTDVGDSDTPAELADEILASLLEAPQLPLSTLLRLESGFFGSRWIDSDAFPAIVEACARQFGTTPAAEQTVHHDDAAVDALAAKMKAKLAKQRAKGYGGWDTFECTQQRLSDMLRDHVAKGDPVDVANFCAFLNARDEGIAHAEVQAEPVAWVHPDYFTAFSKQGFQIVAGKIAPELVPLYTAPHAQPADALDAETPYQRGYRHGYNQRDAEVQGALL